ncbi:MAG: hypothetical protein CMJ65_05725 [Planctomycetaceae bacterium]|nr:hypothetical protein [Planctomycetaceae bacterium]
MTRFLVDLGTEDVPHTGTVFLAHLVGVFNDLEVWDADTPVCRAGMFHSIYGTEMFQAFSFPLERRDEIKALIGERAEFVAWVNCVMDRSTFDQQIGAEAPYAIRDRLTGEMITLDEAQFTDLCTVHLCDWLEQLPRLQKWDYRPAAFLALAERLGGIARESYDRVYASADTQSTT